MSQLLKAKNAIGKSSGTAKNETDESGQEKETVIEKGTIPDNTDLTKQHDSLLQFIPNNF